MFQSLPPEQQQAVLNAIAQSSGGTGTAGGQTGATVEQPDQAQRTLRPNRREGANGLLYGRTGEGEQGTLPPGPPRIQPHSTLLISVTIAPQSPGLAAPSDVAQEHLDADTLKALLQNRRERILAGNPYRLNAAGQVMLPGLTPITLWGLTAEEAAQRLSADPRLGGFVFKVSILPVAPIGADSLEPFGYELFTSDESSFAPPTNVPVPTDYVLGPGDTVIVELFGKRVGRFVLPVDRDGQLHLPDLGPMGVAGMSFDRMKATIEQRIENEMIGVTASVTMGALRTIRIFVTGDVNRPSSYLVSGLSTVTNALFVSGGVSKIGSLRSIEVKRGGRLVTRLDLYALLLNGDSSGDIRLEPGDVVFVPPVGATAGIAGAVRRPAIYEVKPASTIGDLVELAGGLAPEADPHVAKLERIDHGEQRVIIDIDLSRSAALAIRVRSGDVLTVPRVLDEMARTVSLEGEVLRPGEYAWHEGMRLTNLLGGLNALKEDADQRYVLIRREHFPDRRISVASADAVGAFQAPGTAADPVLESHDRVIVFPLQQDRGVALGEVLQELRAQARDDAAPPVVSIAGHITAPGQYPLEQGMRVSDLIRAGGGLDSGAYSLSAELTRFIVVGGQSRRTEVIAVDLAAALDKKTAADLALQPYDVLTVKEVPDWATQGSVTLEGEFQFPGTYPIRKGETLSSVIRRAGGFTKYAFPQGAVFTREQIKEQEQEQIDKLAQRMQTDLTTLALQNVQAPSTSNSGEALRVGEGLLTQLRSSHPIGRLVINVEHAVADPGSDDDVQLRSGDTLIVPRVLQYVTVIGEVQNPTAHIWKHGLGRDDYIAMSGGLTQHADRKRIYVVRADGSVATRQDARWFRGAGVDMQEGDTIVVPLDAQKMPALPMWQAVTQIIYNIAIGVAAIHGL